MSRRLRIAWLPDGKRLNLKDGPMDLIIQGFGRPGDISRAYDAAIARMRNLLDELLSEQSALRDPAPRVMSGRAAQRMAAAVAPFQHKHFITPMAAVAGAVADEMLAAMLGAAQLDRAFVNNGGDIALHLAPGQAFANSALDRPGRPRLNGEFVIEAANKTRGIATAGWLARGYCLGVADAVNVAAVTAAAADAAATIIATAIDLPGHLAVTRVPANELQPGSDFVGVSVTTHVGNLTLEEKRCALNAGVAAGEECRAAGLITGAALFVKGEAAYVPFEDAVPEHDSLKSE